MTEPTPSDPTHRPLATIIDAIMGTGKTTWMVDEMRRRHAAGLFDDQTAQTPFLYIAPTLDEVERIQAACPEMDFTDPDPVGGRKLKHLNQLLREGRNIVSTHALFCRVDRETHAALREGRYVLVIDEVLECVSHWPLEKDDKRALFDHGMVSVDGRGRLRWNHGRWPDYSGRFNDVRDLCDNGNLAWHRGKFLIWELPVDMLACFDQVFILTYLFHGSLMRSYFDLHDVGYEVLSLSGGALVPVEVVDNAAIKARLRDLITIIEDPKLNAPGRPKGRENPLSASWFDRKTAPEISKLKLATENVFRHHAGTPSHQNMWTTFRKVSGSLKGRGYARGFVPVTCKATNDHIDKRTLAYLANIFVHPVEAGYFADHGITVDEDAYALSEMLQWVWRSQIRRGDPITVFIPSERMRSLFKTWLWSNAMTQAGNDPDDMKIAA